MPILKSEVRNKYTTIPNSVIQKCELSDGDFRLLVFLYSLPDGWRINQGYLGTKMKCSRININKKIKRIKEAGYLEIIKAKGNSTDYIYVLKEKYVSVNDVSLRDVSPRDVSLSDTHINTNIINNDNINTNEINNISSAEASDICNNADSKDLYFYVEEAFGRTINGIEYEVISNWKDNELTRYAIKQAVLNGAKSLKYIERILADYRRNGITTLEQAKKRDEDYQDRKTNIGHSKSEVNYETI